MEERGNEDGAEGEETGEEEVDEEEESEEGGTVDADGDREVRTGPEGEGESGTAVCVDMTVGVAGEEAGKGEDEGDKG